MNASLKSSVSEYGFIIHPRTGLKVEITPGFKVGRGHDVNLKLDDLKASRTHLEFFIESDGSLWIKDHSTNGTIVNGIPIIDKYRLDSSCTIIVGHTKIEYHASERSRRPSSGQPAYPQIRPSSNYATPQLSVSNPKQIEDYKENYDDYPPAPYLRRSVALTIDGAIVGILTQISGTIFKFDKTTDLTKMITMVIVSVLLNITISVTYYYLTMKDSGQTIGKKVMNLKVIKLSGDQHFTIWNILFREFLAKSFLGLISVFTVLFSSKKRAFHDYLSGTRVIDIKKNDE
jgi:uncharacterized RDD family membrane protein YckC